MYGSVAHLKAIPGKRKALKHLMDSDPVPVVSGWIASYLFELDENLNHAVFMSVFDDRDTYHANAASPAQHERYEEMSALLTADPDWNDGEMFPYMSFRDASADSLLYGSVAHLNTLPGACDAVNDLLERATEVLDTVPGMLAGYLLLAERDPDLAFMLSVFDSPESYRANSENPAQHERFLEMRSLLTKDPEWHSGYVTPFLRF